MAATVILDISRLFSRRSHSHDTGIDRVERAYLDHFCQNTTNVFLLRFGTRYYFFNAWQIKLLLTQSAPYRNGFLTKIRTHLMLRTRAQSSGVSQKIKDYANSTYINVGHTGHKKNFWERLKAAHIHIITMIHDVIPLDFPQFSRADKIATFERKFLAWTKYSDLIVTPSAYSKERVIHWAQKPLHIVNIKLFAEAYIDGSNETPHDAWLILGTIEPRKNHLLLLHIWQELFEEHGDQIPRLWIIGARGWLDDVTKNLLDHSPLMGKYIIEYGALPDPEMKQKFKLSKGILFPSHVEGFGLPIYEAILSHKPLLASRIPAFTEALGVNSPCLIDESDMNLWKKSLMSQPIHGNVSPISSWSAHIDTLLTHLQN